MTTEKTGDIAGDIEYMRTLAEEGRKAPLLGGRFGLMWGSLTSMALLAEWLILSDRIAVGPQWIGLMWLIMSVTGGVFSIFLGRQISLKPGAGSVGNRASNLVWGVGAISIFVYVLGIVAAVMFGKGDNGDFDTIMPLAFCVYAIAYFTTGALAGNKAMKAIAGLSFVATLVTGALIHQPLAYLVAAIFVVLTAVIPGLVMMRAEPAAIV